VIAFSAMAKYLLIAVRPGRERSNADRKKTQPSQSPRRAGASSRPSYSTRTAATAAPWLPATSSSRRRASSWR
jgi:hypothetical protein